MCCHPARALAVITVGYCIGARNQHSARKLARRLGVSHTWVNRLARHFTSATGRQERWEPFTLDDLRAEQAQRKGDYARYRQPQIQRKPQPPQVVKDANGHILYDPDALKRQVDEILKAQRGRSMSKAPHA